MTKSERYSLDPVVGISGGFWILEDGCRVAEVSRPGRGDENEATAKRLVEQLNRHSEELS